MAKHSFRDLLNFEAIQPVKDSKPTTKSGDSLIEAPQGATHPTYNVNKVSGGGLGDNKEKGRANWDLNQTLTDADYALTAAGLDKVSKVLGNATTVFKALNFFLHNDPLSAPPNMRDESIAGKLLNKASGALGNFGASALNRSSKYMGEWDTNSPKTARDYSEAAGLAGVMDFTVKDSSLPGNSSSTPMNMQQETIVGKAVKKGLSKILTGRWDGLDGGDHRITTFTPFNKLLNGILQYPDSVVDYYFNQFSTDERSEAGDKVEYTNLADYYKNISSPYFDTAQVKNPKEALNFACNYLGFSKGYKDWRGFSVGSEHIWGMTIKPYWGNKTEGLLKPLPVIEVPIWTRTDDNTLTLKTGEFDFGNTPPVLSYNLNFGTSREKEIQLYNDSKISIPLGFAFQNLLSVDFADDANLSLKKYFNYYFNTICVPSKGLMLPYDKSAFLITLTIFKPGLKVNFMFQFIAIPINYAINHEGSSEVGNGATIKVDFNIIGMKPVTSSDSVENSIGSYWSLMTWDKVILKQI